MIRSNRLFFLFEPFCFFSALLAVCCAWPASALPQNDHFSRDTVEVVFFYDKGCSRCAAVEAFFTRRILPHYPVAITRLEIHEPGNAPLMIRLARVYRSQAVLIKGTPAVFIGDQAFQGHSRVVLRNIETAVRSACLAKPPSPLERLPAEDSRTFAERIPLPAVILAAAVDSINPCAIAILTLLLSTMLLASGGKKWKVLGAGFAFSAACFICYFLLGLGLFSAVHGAGIQHAVFIAMAVLAVLLGLWNVKDAIHVGKWVYQVPRAWQAKMRKLASGIQSVPGAFGIGVLISLFLLPCSSGPYVVIIGMLGNTATQGQAAGLLLLYNAIFILPFLAITLIIGLGIAPAERLEKWRTLNLARFNLVTGLVMIAIGIGMAVLAALGVV